MTPDYITVRECDERMNDMREGCEKKLEASKMAHDVSCRYVRSTRVTILLWVVGAIVLPWLVWLASRAETNKELNVIQNEQINNLRQNGELMRMDMKEIKDDLKLLLRRTASIDRSQE